MVLSLGHDLVFGERKSIRGFQVSVRSSPSAAWLAIIFQMIAISFDEMEVRNGLVLFASLATLFSIGTQNSCRLGISNPSFRNKLGNAFSAVANQTITIFSIPAKMLCVLGGLASSAELAFWNGYFRSLSKSLVKLAVLSRSAVSAIDVQAIRTPLARAEISRRFDDMTRRAFFRFWNVQPLSRLKTSRGLLSVKALFACGYAYRPWTQSILFSGRFA